MLGYLGISWDNLGHLRIYGGFAGSGSGRLLAAARGCSRLFRLLAFCGPGPAIPAPCGCSRLLALDFCGGCALAVGFLLGMFARGGIFVGDARWRWDFCGKCADILGYLGISWDILEYPGISWAKRKGLGPSAAISWNILGYPGISWDILAGAH